MAQARFIPPLFSLPDELLVLLSDHLHNIEDLMNFSSTCTRLRSCMSSTTPSNILRLAAAQDRIFFHPCPYFLLLATARELGHWARRTPANEALFAETCKLGVDGLFSLSLRYCGLTLARVRELHLLRFSVINPVTDVMDKCVGNQWYETPDFWNGGVSDAYTIHSEPAESFFHLAIYGELFAPELESFLDGVHDAPRLSVDTRLEFVKYCVPDWITIACHSQANLMPDGSIDPRREAGHTGPYSTENAGEHGNQVLQHNLALIWVLQSSRWRPYWKEARREAGAVDFLEGMDDSWQAPPDSRTEYWRQRLWENVMICQGIDGLGMMRSDLRVAWFSKIREWREKIERLQRDDPGTTVGRQTTEAWPYLMGDLRILISGYTPGT